MQSIASRSYHYRLLLLIIALFFGFLLILQINNPFVGPNAFNFNIYSLIAHNYLQFGYFQTKFAPISSVYNNLPAHPVYYLHHPTLLSLIESVFFAVLGEQFWTGRLSVIIFSFGSLFLFYFLGKEVRQERCGIWLAGLYTLMPGSVVFGRMIGQEPLVLFFSLALTVCLLTYFRTKKTYLLLFAFLFVLLGIMSDWPMTYFVASLLPVFYVKKQLRLYVWFLMFSFIATFSYLLYIYFLMHGWEELWSAIIERSAGQLTSIAWWPLRWGGLIILRLLVYDNPMIIGMGLVGLLQMKNGKLRMKDKVMSRISFFTYFVHDIHAALVCSFLLFGLVHIVLYPYGSFGHPYWIYYLTPFFVLSVGLFVTDYFFTQRQQFLLFLFIVCSVIWLLGVDQWKMKEEEGNVWRFTIAALADQYLHPYERIAINQTSVVSVDAWAYSFKQQPIIVDSVNNLPSHISYFVYTCQSCDKSDPTYRYLVAHYPSHEAITLQARGYIFALTQPFSHPVPPLLTTSSITQNMNSSPTSNASPHLFQRFYAWLLTTFQAPQI